MWFGGRSIMVRVRVGKKRVIIGLTIVIAITIIATLGIGRIKVVNANKISSSLELGIKYLTEGKYDKAKEEFLRVTSIDNTHEEAIKLMELIDDYLKLENLYKKKEYVSALDLINKINENKYSKYIGEKVNELSVYIEEKIKIINEINNIDGQIDKLISENKYEEAISLINGYLEQDLEEEYSNKLNTLMSKVNDSKRSYDEEQKRIAELLTEVGISDKRMKLLEPIILNTAWMKAKLDDAREAIKNSNIVILYDNGGGQKGIRENPLFKGYENLWRSYMAGMAKLLESLPQEQIEQAAEIEKPVTMLELVRNKHREKA